MKKELKDKVRQISNGRLSEIKINEIVQNLPMETEVIFTRNPHQLANEAKNIEMKNIIQHPMLVMGDVEIGEKFEDDGGNTNPDFSMYNLQVINIDRKEYGTSWNDIKNTNTTVIYVPNQEYLDEYYNGLKKYSDALEKDKYNEILKRGVKPNEIEFINTIKGDPRQYDEERINAFFENLEKNPKLKLVYAIENDFLHATEDGFYRMIYQVTEPDENNISKIINGIFPETLFNVYSWKDIEDKFIALSEGEYDYGDPLSKPVTKRWDLEEFYKAGNYQGYDRRLTEILYNKENINDLKNYFISNLQNMNESNCIDCIYNKIKEYLTKEERDLCCRIIDNRKKYNKIYDLNEVFSRDKYNKIYDDLIAENEKEEKEEMIYSTQDKLEEKNFKDRHTSIKERTGNHSDRTRTEIAKQRAKDLRNGRDSKDFYADLEQIDGEVTSEERTEAFDVIMNLEKQKLKEEQNRDEDESTRE